MPNVCLNRITQKSTSIRTITAYKVFAIFPLFGGPVLRTPQISRDIEAGKWLTARGPWIPTSDHPFTKYSSGFHAITTLEDAKRYALYYGMKGNQYVIVPVKLRGKKTFGVQDGVDCVVAKEMKVEARIAKKALRPGRNTNIRVVKG